MKRFGLRGLLSFLWLCLAAAMLPASPRAESRAAEAFGPAPTKTSSTFYGSDIAGRMRQAAKSTPEGSRYRDATLIAAGPWMWMEDKDIWELPVGPGISRSWMVWSNGHCPACGQSVPMYEWIIDAQTRRFKVQCPRCMQIFPTNNFESYYVSGLNQAGTFDPARANRSLLFNTAHPDPADPLHLFGVDDGEGYVADGQRWRFIGAYLVYGQWKQLVVAGLRALSDAYVMTGDVRYARKAGILLDRVADLYPDYDYARQGFVYEQKGNAGYVSVWHDAVEETREIALAYDKIFDGIKSDAELVGFLSRQARLHGLKNPKTSFDLIQRNIETRILRDANASPDKIHANFPRMEAAMATMTAILGWPANRDEAERIIDRAAAQASAVDGVTGEKGLSAYSAYTIQGLAALLALFERTEPGFIARTIERIPTLARTWRFHLDTLCLGTFYPRIGDAGALGEPTGEYLGVVLRPSVSTAPSMYSFLYDLYRATHDPDYARLLYQANGRKVEGLPYDLAATDAPAVQSAVQRVIETQGAEYDLGSVNLRQWHLAILRSGTGANERAVWLDYDAGGAHGHYDGMNIGLFAKGKDLLPDFGYPPVQYGGWQSPRALWYLMTAAHNTVVVDRLNQRVGAGTTSLWAPGAMFKAVAAEGASMTPGSRYERTAVLVDLDDKDSYVLDVFRVKGGIEHLRSTGSLPGTVTTGGLRLAPSGGTPPGIPSELRIVSADPDPAEGWWAEWSLAGGVRLRQTDLTRHAEAVLAEAWVSLAEGSFSGTETAWLPRFMSRRRQATGALESTFVALIEPYSSGRPVEDVRRLDVRFADETPAPDSAVAVEARHGSGRADLILIPDSSDSVLVPDWGLRYRGKLCIVRRGPGGVERVLVAEAGELEVGGRRLVTGAGGFVEIDLTGGTPRVVAGVAELIKSY